MSLDVGWLVQEAPTTQGQSGTDSGESWLLSRDSFCSGFTVPKTQQARGWRGLLIPLLAARSSPKRHSTTCSKLIILRFKQLEWVHRMYNCVWFPYASWCDLKLPSSLPLCLCSCCSFYPECPSKKISMLNCYQPYKYYRKYLFLWVTHPSLFNQIGFSPPRITLSSPLLSTWTPTPFLWKPCNLPNSLK